MNLKHWIIGSLTLLSSIGVSATTFGQNKDKENRRDGNPPRNQNPLQGLRDSFGPGKGDRQPSQKPPIQNPGQQDPVQNPGFKPPSFDRPDFKVPEFKGPGFKVPGSKDDDKNPDAPRPPVTNPKPPNGTRPDWPNRPGWPNNPNWPGKPDRPDRPDVTNPKPSQPNRPGRPDRPDVTNPKPPHAGHPQNPSRPQDDHNHNHGWNQGRYNRGNYPRGWSFYIPIFPSFRAGQYYVENGIDYYVPPPTQIGGAYTTAKPVVVEFGGFSHYQELSGILEMLTNELLLDMHYNYQHNPGFQELYRASYQLMEDAKFIRAADHNRDADAMRERLSMMDPLFHDIQAQVSGWSRIHRRQVGTLGVGAKLESIEATLHHLMNDVGISDASLMDSESTQPPVMEVAPPPSIP